jgi:nucleoside-diphosphate-sugar epimerase
VASPEHYYFEQKAACEAALVEITGNSRLDVYVLRPYIVAGPKAPALLKPPFPDPGIPLQLVHHDDVAAAIALAATASAPPGLTTSRPMAWCRCRRWPKRSAPARCGCPRWRRQRRRK